MKKSNRNILLAKLKDFDLDLLDDYEIMVFNDFNKRLSKEESLEIIINTVEGDFSQLSDHLRELVITLN